MTSSGNHTARSQEYKITGYLVVTLVCLKCENIHIINNTTNSGGQKYMTHLYSCPKYLACKASLFLHCIIMSSTASLALPNLSTLSHKWYDFQKQVIEHKTCFHFLYFSHFKKTWVRYYHKLNRSSCKVPIIIVRFYPNLNFHNRFFKNPQV